MMGKKKHSRIRRGGWMKPACHLAGLAVHEIKKYALTKFLKMDRV